MRQLNRVIPMLFVAVLVTACATVNNAISGMRDLITTYEVARFDDPEYRAEVVEGGVHYSRSRGVPTLAERYAERPGVKIALIQAAVSVEGQLPGTLRGQGGEQEVHTRRWTTSSPYMTTTYTMTWVTGHVEVEYLATESFEVPPEVGFDLAFAMARSVESQLAEAGFDVIPYREVAETDAYQQAYGPYGYMLPMESPPEWNETGTEDARPPFPNWATYAAPPLRTTFPQGFLAAVGNLQDGATAAEAERPTAAAWGHTNSLQVGAEALREIEEELGGDVLFLTLSGKYRLINDQVEVTETDAHGTEGAGDWYSFALNRQGMIAPEYMATLYDPDYVGYGVGGMGVITATLNSKFVGAPLPDFMVPVGDDRFKADWPVLMDTAGRVTTVFAEAVAHELKEARTPPES